MQIDLLRYTPHPEALIASAYGICTGKDRVPLSQITHWIVKGHESPIEHASATFRIEGISRSCSHQLVRHRLASFSQRSQRYCTEEGWVPIVPATVERDATAQQVFDMAVSHAKRLYLRLRRLDVPDEDARFVLPNTTPTAMIMSANFREWLYIIRLRSTPEAQWEIRAVILAVRECLEEIAPHVFNKETIR